MKEKLRVWLEKSGYPLELYVHKIAYSKGYICEKSQMYSDIETGIAREIDLIASKHGTCNDKYTYELNFIIECKKSEKPLMLLSDGKKAERYEQLFGHDIVDGKNDGNLRAFQHLYKLDAETRKINIRTFSEQVLSGYSLVPGFGKSDENLYKGLMGVAKADEYFLNEYSELNVKGENEPDWFKLQVAVIVVDAPLFTVHLDELGELEIEETHWGSMLIRLPWKMGKSDSEKLCNIQVVRKEYFNEFLSSVEDFHEYISREENLYNEDV